MEVTSELFDSTEKYLIGPYSDNEVLPEHPTEFYVSGLLFPNRSRPSSEDLETLDAGGNGNEGSETVHESKHPSSQLLTNSLGLRCNLVPETREIKTEIKFARYVLDESGWRRIPFTKQILVRIDEGNEIGIPSDDDNDDELIAKLSWKVDKDQNSDPPTYKTLVMFLSNEQDDPDKTNEKGETVGYLELKNIRNERILFQPQIKLSAEKEKTFLGTDIAHDRALFDDELSLDMLYRQRTVYGQGYNCSADWDRAGNNPSYIKTELLPQYQSKQIMFSADGDENRPDLVDMAYIEDAESPDDVYDLLKDIPERYSKWIDNLAASCSDIRPGNRYESVAKDNQEKCQKALERIRTGLQILRDPNHGDVFEAFKITNRAMLYQRVHYKFAIERAKGKKNLPKTPDTRKKNENYWRPFQLAFLLMNIRGMSDTVSDYGLAERRSVDLLWFPTGGGKTEAYLALSAFSLVLRRMRRGETDGSGVSVIMRYTLRLLTIQQFERAATLICALEVFRRKDKQLLGDEPFLIGLWVGEKLTPNSWQNSKKSLYKISRNESPDTGSPVQLVFCPWCGHDISYRNYQVDEKRTKWTIVHCVNPGCEFYHRDKLDTSLALPVLTVDFDIYRRCPSVLIATVDKFARIPWKPEISSLFGIVDRKCERCGFLTNTSSHRETSHREQRGKSRVEPINRLQPPDLIIQDELHLITGPVGTMVGLYETAVEYLCSWNTNDRRLKPKIVVSTATVKGVERQVKNLFNRNSVETFPPPGVNFGDTFFWWESKTGGRKYVGVSYSHRSMKFVLGKLYAILLQRTLEIKEESGNALDIDPYWTLVGYFNSKRELGGTIRLVEDDVKSNIGKIISLLPAHRQKPERSIGKAVELTGGVKGQEIKEVRTRLEMNSESDQSIDVLLATNMISVGIDIDRLGLMVVNGQTKGVSEYIQATGRVGRRENVPGMIFALYNPYKPRDLSHYENFIGDHIALQRSVETVGLTPFSDRAMDRSLHAILLGMIRLTIPNLSSNHDADSFRLGNHDIQEICGFILARFSSVQNVDESHEEYRRVSNKLQQFLDNWNQYVNDSHRTGEEVFYSDDSQYDKFGSVKKKTRILMTDFASKDVSDSKGFPKPTPGSLRDVETEAKMFYDW